MNNQDPKLHVALIMDGNGRWAAARNLPRRRGHLEGARRVEELIEAAPEMGIGALSLYAFSTENWKRPAWEISALFELFRAYFGKWRVEQNKSNARIRFIGDRTAFPTDIQALMAEIERSNPENAELLVNFAMNYGARAEILSAVRRLAEQVADGEKAVAELDEAALDGALYTADAPPLDLLIRTSGERRLSNFLLWQAAYAELSFVAEPFPEFGPEALRAALEDFRGRDRRFGGLNLAA